MSRARNIHRSLVTRVAVLALVTGAVTAFALVALLGMLARSSTDMKVGLTICVVAGLALLVGWLSSRLVVGPLKKFEAALVLLQANDYKTPLPASDIMEFEQVFTGLAELAKRLQREEELRKDLISDTSHELNTPLTALTGQLAAMQDGKLPITKERIGVVKQQADRLSELVGQLDAYTRARTPQASKPQPIHLKEMCQRLFNEYTLELKAKKIQAVTRIADDVVISANQQALQQILQNILQNALRYSHATEFIITADTYSLTVSDNGTGVPPDSLAYLFERFYRVDKSRNRTTGGLGLGLAIVKELVEQQGWTIRAEDAHPGLTFVITF